MIDNVNSWQRSRTPADARAKRKVQNVKSERLKRKRNGKSRSYGKRGKPIRLNLNLFRNSFLSLFVFLAVGYSSENELARCVWRTFVGDFNWHQTKRKCWAAVYTMSSFLIWFHYVLLLLIVRLTFQFFCFIKDWQTAKVKKIQKMMNILTFLCVILSCACAAGLDLDTSKSDDIFHLLAILIIKNELKQVPYQGYFLTLHLYNQIMVAWINFFDLLVQMSTRTTKLSFAT